MATKKPTAKTTQRDETNDPLSPEETAARDSMQVQVLRAQDDSPIVIMCKMPRPGRDLAFTATIKKKGTDVQIDGAVQSTESTDKK